MQIAKPANRNTYIGLFLLTQSLLMYEILLTRIFSVIAYYHFAFMAISIAMFGMSLGALLIYLLPQYQKENNTHEQLAFAALLFSLTLFLSFILLLSLPLKFDFTLDGLLITTTAYLLISIPFVFGGMCVCLILTKYLAQINSLYAIDLLGAGLGCLTIIILLNIFSGPTAVIVVSAFAGIGAIFFAKNSDILNVKRASILSTLLLFALVIMNVALEINHTPFIRLSWIKNQIERLPLYEKWNSFSRLSISGDPWQRKPPFGWGLSEIYPDKSATQYLWLRIDSWAGTPLTHYRNNLAEIDYLKYDVTNIAHYLRPEAKVLIIGVGGGRDILSSVVFKQRLIVGVEINRDILKILTKHFADYTGHINKLPNLTLINDEARSYISRSPDKFNIIQMSLIDTWAATSAGAFTLSENSLYTREAFQIFLNHLTEQGLLSVSRYYLPNQPAEMFRLTALASESLLKLGISNPEKHIIIISSKPIMQDNAILASIATTLISRNPFSKEDINTIQMLANKFHFTILFAPSIKNDSLFAKLAAHQMSKSFFQSHALDITPPSDDKPFFFQMIKLSSLFDANFWNTHSYFGFNNYAVVTVAVLLVTVLFLTLLCLIIPLLLTTRKHLLPQASPLLFYFACIGLGFMLIEISQIQRLTLFLGHPTYGLSIVLFSLLLSTGFGSLFLSRTTPNLFVDNLIFVLLLFILCVFGVLSSPVILYFQMSSILVRIAITMIMLFPLGLLLGTALPIGMHQADKLSRELTPWLWGMNGSLSICGSVFAIAIALMKGIATVFWIGVLCYFFAFIAYLLAKALQLQRTVITEPVTDHLLDN